MSSQDTARIGLAAAMAVLAGAMTIREVFNGESFTRAALLALLTGSLFASLVSILAVALLGQEPF